jgi:hypothetical protein
VDEQVEFGLLAFNACDQSKHQDEQNQGGFHAGADASHLALSERTSNHWAVRIDFEFC